VLYDYSIPATGWDQPTATGILSDGECMNKQPEITEQTRSNLLEAFWSLYAELRIDQITVKEITARAGYNRGTFYEYFADVRQCLDLIEARSLPRLDELPPMPEDPAPSPDFIESFIKLYKEKFKYYDVLLGDKGDPSFQRRLIDCIKAAIVNSRKLPAFIGTVELDYMLEYILSGMIGIMRYYFHNRPKGSQAEMVAIIYKLMSSDIMQQVRGLHSKL
jgi:AcrR family transcriptional regulator